MLLWGECGGISFCSHLKPHQDKRKSWESNGWFHLFMRHCELWDTNRDWVIALWALPGLDGMNFLTTAKERMFLEKEDDFQYVLSKPCFYHNLLSSLENRRTSWHVQTSVFQVAPSQLGGEQNFVWNIFCCQDFVERHGNICAAEAAMTLGFIFHLPCFPVALQQN